MPSLFPIIEDVVTDIPKFDYCNQSNIQNTPKLTKQKNIYNLKLEDAIKETGKALSIPLC